MKHSLATARRLALYAQGLDGHWTLPSGKEGAAQVIERLGYVQIDTIHVIERAHHHTLWTRYPSYTPAMLHDLLAEDRRVFEWWTHAMSYIPIRDYRYYKSRMGLKAVNARRRKLLEEHPGILDHVRQRIQEKGPLGSADFKKPKDFEGGWWNWKPAKHALEALFNMGELMVTRRHNFQRIFDLTERVLPPEVDTTPPTPEEMQAYRVRLIFNKLGVIRKRDVSSGRRKINPDHADGLHPLDKLVARGEAIAFEVESLDDGPCYAPTDVFNAVAQQRSDDTRPLHILSPFDNFTIHRAWVEAFFGFDYSLECYIPAAKRQYGYFVLPILWGDRFIARMDSKANRKPRTFIIRRLLFEPDFSEYDKVLPILADKLRAFAAFNGCDTFTLEDVQPEKIKAPLVKLLSP
jgi:hypothetical protein